MDTINEGAVILNVFQDTKISKKLEVFYNPVMKFNRDTSILLLNSISNMDLQIALPLSGSGVRGIRFIRELNEGKIKNIKFNDYSKSSVKLIQENLKLNGLKYRKLRKLKLLEVFNEDANLFLLNSQGYDYIDIDPFGPPIPFLDTAIRRLSKGGILAITATDTSALSGTYPKACWRKYWAKPKKDYLMHETGLRILIRRVQLIGMSLQKALIPILSYSKDHYFRVFFRCEKSKSACDEVFKKQGMLGDVGPLWKGDLWDPSLLKKMVDNNTISENSNYLNLIYNESLIGGIGFYDIHVICKEYKLNVPKFEDIFNKIRTQGFKAS